jgi:hypothetical protein
MSVTGDSGIQQLKDLSLFRQLGGRDIALPHAGERPGGLPWHSAHRRERRSSSYDQLHSMPDYDDLDHRGCFGQEGTGYSGARGNYA